MLKPGLASTGILIMICLISYPLPGIVAGIDDSGLIICPESIRGLEILLTGSKDISFEQLAGLQFYNLAVYYYNHQQFRYVIPLLNKALALYHSRRIMEFKTLLVSR